MEEIISIQSISKSYLNRSQFAREGLEKYWLQGNLLKAERCHILHQYYANKYCNQWGGSVEQTKFNPQNVQLNFKPLRRAPIIEPKIEIPLPNRRPPINQPKPKVEVPKQPTPISIENFFICTMGVFTELQYLPEGFDKFFSSKGSTYYTNESKTELIRVSDHWGYNIRFCSWHLHGYKKNTSYKWQKHVGKERKIGHILFSDLSPNNRYWQPKKYFEPESRHPF